MIHKVLDGKHVWVGCFVFKGSKIVLLFNEDKKRWEIPGGKVQEGQEIKEALKEGLKKDLGSEIVLDELEDFGETDFITASGKKCKGFVFLTRVLKGEVSLDEPDVLSDYKYVDLEELDKYPISNVLKSLIKKFNVSPV
tara:strand:- start:24 stop:440 length:417 start_codon:yes stop_codon:yes gene_type:complete